MSDFETSGRCLECAYRAYRKDGRSRRAALAACHLGRLQHSGFGNAVLAAGWLARALRLLEGDEQCVERGWVALALIGCSIASADALERDAGLALRLARELDDVDLECRALADSGLALVDQGRFDDGMNRIDEAMTMASSGECDNIFITGQVTCSFISACERVGDLPRLQAWLAVETKGEPLAWHRDATPSMMLNHCRSAYGSLLCLAGRWAEAEATLRDSMLEAESLGADQRFRARTVLADLRISQGRWSEAAELLDGLEAYADAQLRLELATVLATLDPVAARSEARRALAGFSPIGAQQRFAAQDLLHRLEGGPASADHGPLGVLTNRERQVLTLLAQGMSNPEIATRLVISTKTAEHHVGNILRKLRLRGRSEAAVYAATLGR
ncbi:MAG: LuxR C-terminal-related transcriptional regulator [Nocardioidaceae bacterium]